MSVLRIIFTILSAVCLAALLPAGTFGGMPYVFVCAGGAGLFFLLMLLCKKIQDKKQPQEPTPDFLNPNPSNTDEKEDKQ